MSWNRGYSTTPHVKMPSATKQRARARRIERAFVKKHGVSSMEHLSQVMKGINEVFEDCGCYPCLKHFFERKTQRERMRATKFS